MSIALVQKSASAGIITGTLPANSTVDNLLIAHIVSGGGAPSPPASWVLAIGNTTDRAWIYYYENNPGGLSSFDFGTSTVRIIITEWSGVATSSSLDTTGINSAASSPVTATTSGNVAVANSLAVGAVGEVESKNGTTTMGAGSGWTNELDNGSDSVSTHLLASSQLNPTAGSTLAEAGSSSSMILTLLGVAIAVFKPASVAAVPRPSRRPRYAVIHSNNH